MSPPRAVTAFGMLALLLGIAALAVFSVLVLFALMGICGGGVFTASGGAGSPATMIGVMLLGIALIGQFAALVVIALAIGTLGLKRWAWVVAVSAGGVLALGGAVAGVYSLLIAAPTLASTLWEPLLLVVGGLILAYALSPSVRRAFGFDVDAGTARRTLQST